MAAADLEDLLRGLCPAAVRLSWELAQLDFAGDLREAGLAFTPDGEVRWDGYRVLVLTDRLLNLPSDWRSQEETPWLIPTSSRQFAPAFGQHPEGESRPVCPAAGFIAKILPPLSVPGR
jgi:hypothetical protein